MATVHMTVPAGQEQAAAKSLCDALAGQLPADELLGTEPRIGVHRAPREGERFSMGYHIWAVDRTHTVIGPNCGCRPLRDGAVYFCVAQYSVEITGRADQPGEVWLQSDRIAPEDLVAMVAAADLGYGTPVIR